MLGYRPEGGMSNVSIPNTRGMSNMSIPNTPLVVISVITQTGMLGCMTPLTCGNMRNVHFVAESPDIDILDRKYAWGESGMAEMCQMHCKARGRGHVHLRRCPRNEPFGKCAEEWYDRTGAKHETKQYGPDLDVAKDEFTHQAYWELMNFKDPCQEEDVAQFGMCNHFCLSQEHQQVSVARAQGHDSGNADLTGRSYCIQGLWHQPVPDTTWCRVGYVSKDGHAFSCQHADTKAHHVVFAIDRSSSMGLQDIKPVLAQMALRHNNRLGCVFEAALRVIKARVAAGCSDIVSFILFDSQAVVVTERAVVSEDLVKLLLGYTLGRGTAYSRGLEKANEVLVRAKNRALHKFLAPAVIFLSDGENCERIIDSVSVIAGMKKEEPRLVLHTLLFGSHEETVVRTLESMANAGGGTFQCSIDELGLASNFEFLARSLQPQVAALM